MPSRQLALWLAILVYSAKSQYAHGEDQEARLGDCAPILTETLPKVRVLSESCSCHTPRWQISRLKFCCLQVALLFLVRGPQPHEQLWTQWLSNLAEMAPATVQCNETAWTCYKTVSNVPKQSAYDKQQYYSLYVHTKPDFPGYPPGSIFAGRVVQTLHKVSPCQPAKLISLWYAACIACDTPRRRLTFLGLLQTAWGSMSLVSATLELLRAALTDPRNQRFQLLCEATVPVRPALFIYEQLLAERRSRMPLLQMHEGPVVRLPPTLLVLDCPSISILQSGHSIH